MTIIYNYLLSHYLFIQLQTFFSMCNCLNVQRNWSWKQNFSAISWLFFLQKMNNELIIIRHSHCSTFKTFIQYIQIVISLAKSHLWFLNIQIVKKGRIQHFVITEATEPEFVNICNIGIPLIIWALEYTVVFKHSLVYSIFKRNYIYDDIFCRNNILKRTDYYNIFPWYDRNEYEIYFDLI
jgi:hypothetical protein